MKRLPLYLALACGILPVVQAEDAAPSERIREGEARQQQLRGEAQKLVEQLDTMLDEYQRNALGGEDTKTVQTLRDSLARLSLDEMKQVIDLLEKARVTTDAGEAKQRVADAYSSQKAILAKMTRLLADHQRDQQAAELAQQLAQLAERQAVNLQNGINLGQWSGDKKPENFEAAMEANLKGQQAEQASISDELKVLAQKVSTFAKDPENAEHADRFKKGMEAIAKVQPSVENASAALKDGQLFKAVGDEKNARDAMRQLAKEIAPPPERAEVLRTAQKEVAKAIEDQKEIAKEATKAAGEKDFDKWVEEQKKTNPRLAKMSPDQLRKDAHLRSQFNAQANGKPEQLAEQEHKQGELAARSDELAQSLAKAAPEAAKDVKAATDKMQEARGAMNDRNGAATKKNAEDALAALQMADAKLQQELAKADALAGKSGDPVKDLQALQQQAQMLAQQQAAAAMNPDKAAQAALAQKVNELAKQAAAQAPMAAKAAQQAAAQAQQAAQAAQAGQPAAAAQAQQQAAQNLAQAAQQIAQQAAAAQQAQQQQAAVQQAQQQLADIIIAEQNLQVETAKSAALVAKKKVAKASDFKGQGSKQGEIVQQAVAFEQTLPPDAPAVNSALDAAQAAMKDAQVALEKPEVDPAKFSEALALEKLYAAQSALEAAAAQAQQAMPQQQQAAAAQQQAAAQQAAAAQLAQAQQQVAQANQALQQAQQPGQPAAAQQKAAQQAAAQLAKAAAQAGQAAAQIPPGNNPAQQAAQNGAQAAAQGAAQAAGQNLAAAQAQAQAAQQALAQAQAAMAQSQAGLTAANGSPGMPMPSGSPSSSPSNKPGQKPGNTPGKMPGPPNGQPGSEAAQEYQPPTGNETVQVQTRDIASRKAAFTSLPARERAVIEQAQSEKYPEEYGTQVEQYLLNLARESAAKK